MVHIHREFVKAFESYQFPAAGEAVERIAKIYEVEKKVRFKSSQERVALRQEYAKPIFDDLEAWLRAQLNRISRKTPLAKAIRYALTRMPKARVYLDHGFWSWITTQQNAPSGPSHWDTKTVFSWTRKRAVSPPPLPTP
jgi:hypothetical protein